jgi:hypothetical protein
VNLGLIGWTMSAEILGMSLLTIADGAAFWSANNPSFMTTRSFTTAGGNKAETIREDIRIGGVKAVIETALVGFGAALILSSWWPLLLPMVYMVVQWLFFAWALKNPHGHAEGIAAQ